MPSSARLGDVLRKLRRFGCEVVQRSATHWKATRIVAGVLCVAGFAAERGGRYVKKVYCRKLQEQLHIGAEEWDGA